MPELEDPNFSRTVTLICQHDSNGALGVIVNRAIESLSVNDVLHQCILVLGYAGWGAGQLDQEIKKNAWLTVPANPTIIFDVGVEERWTEAVSFLGVNVGTLSGSMGHA